MIDQPPIPVTARSVDKGKHDYKPSAGLNLGLIKRDARLHAFTVTFSLTEAAWFNPTDKGPIGTDGKDWNKIGGYSYARLFSPSSWPKNRNAVLVGWRPTVLPGVFEYCLYVNDADGGFTASEPIVVAANELVTASIVVFADRMQGNIALHSAHIRDGVRLILERTTYRSLTAQVLLPIKYRVGTWFGGNRTAPHDHVIHVDTTDKI